MAKTLRVVLAMMATVGLGAGCSDDSSCIEGNQVHSYGTSFPSSDGCNTCWCRAGGQIDCTLMACLPRDGGPDLFARPDSRQPDRTIDTSVDKDVKDAPIELGQVGETGNRETSLDVAAGDVGVDVGFGLDAVVDIGVIVDAGALDGRPLDVGSADGGQGCVWKGAMLAPGQVVHDQCNDCACTSTGSMLCTSMTCPIGQDDCSMPARLIFGPTAANLKGSFVYRVQLDNTGMTMTKAGSTTAIDAGSTRTCEPTLPVCGLADQVTVWNIVTDLADPDVQSALASSSPVLFGVDSRPTGGIVWSIAEENQQAILVGSPCPSPTMDSCRPIPAGVQRLADDVKKLSEAMLAEPACAALW
jgi:hypothetical protein